jgi:hypothetical protein
MTANLTRALSILALLVVITSTAAAADPGIPIPGFLENRNRVSDQARGFMLIYNIYTSSTANPGAQNTRFNIYQHKRWGSRCGPSLLR